MDDLGYELGYSAGILVYGNSYISKHQLSEILNQFSKLVEYKHEVDIYIPKDSSLCVPALANTIRQFIYDKIGDDDVEYPIDYRLYGISTDRLFEPYYVQSKVQLVVCITTPTLFEESNNIRGFHQFLHQTSSSLRPTIVIPHTIDRMESNYELQTF